MLATRLRLEVVVHRIVLQLVSVVTAFPLSSVVARKEVRTVFCCLSRLPCKLTALVVFVAILKLSAHD